MRLVRVTRNGAQHELKDISVDIKFQGDFDPVYTEGDNSKVLPTDTMKNTVYALAKRDGLASIESFGQMLARHFLANNFQVKRVRINSSCVAR